MNKRGFAVLPILIALGLGLLTFYLLLYLPIFTNIRTTINYFLILGAFVLLQVALIYGYVRIGLYVKKGIDYYQNMLLKWTVNIKRMIG